jgi:hypothetical protein
MATTPIFEDVPEWPTRTASAPAPAGHNRPPVEDEARAEFREALLSDRPEFETTLANIIDAAPRAKATNDDEYGRCGSYIKTARAAKKHIEDSHRTAKQRYLDGGRAVDGEKNSMLSALDQAASSVQAKMNAYAAEKEARERAERERIAAEERAAAARAAEAERARQAAEAEARRAAAEATNAEEREAAEQRAAEARRVAEEAAAQAALAPAAPARAEPVRSDDGATVSTKTVWNCRVDDHAKAFKAVKSDPKVKEAIEAAAARLVRAGQREVAGCTVWPTQQAVAR